MENTNIFETIIRPADYVGSFLVNGQTQKERTEIVYKKLESMRNVTQKKSILLMISLSGIKVCNETGESVRMAHALRRISYATSDPDYCQFSFLAREPKGQANVQYCHTFITKTSALAEELNDIVGDAFRLAYSKQKLPPCDMVTIPQSFNNKNDHKLICPKPSSMDETSRNVNDDRYKQKFDTDQEEKDFDGYNLLSGNTSKKPSSGESTKINDSKTVKPIPILATQSITDRRLTNPVRKVPSATNFYDLKQTPRKSLPDPPDESCSHNSAISSRIERNNYDETDDLVAEVSLESSNNRDLTPPWMYANRKSKSAFAPKPHKTSAFQPHQAVNMNNNIGSQDFPCPGTHGNIKSGKSDRPISGEHKYKECAPLPPQRMDSLPSYDLTERGCAEGESLVGTGATSLPRKYCPITTDTSTIYMGSTSGSSDKSTSHDPIKDAAKWPEKWYQPDIPREVALDLLSKGQVGSFVVRDSSSHTGCYALSVRISSVENSDSVIHYLIQRTSTGFKMKGLEKEWPTMKSLVTHLTVMPEMLPCTLVLVSTSKRHATTTTSNPAFCPIDVPSRRIMATNFPDSFGPDSQDDDGDQDDDYDDDLDYQRLSDFSSMMADLCLL